ncbi:hypothetical protein BG004_000639 [Podila humilis]|nr:hypothetical protein BG004_000639 [Podila humilis]
MLPSSRLFSRAATLAANHRSSASHHIQSRIFTASHPRSIFNAHQRTLFPAASQASSIVRWSTTHATHSSSSSSSPAQEQQPSKKACCPSTLKKSASATTTDSTTTTATPHHVKSTLPASSLQFWSDPTTWKVASTNTFRCLVGCTAGDMSMLFYLQSQHPEMSPGLVMAAAMTSGVLTSITLETVILRFSRASNMSWPAAFKTATGMSLISMLTMEAVENAVDYHLMGWNNIDLTSPLFWQAIGLSAFAGWSAPLPFNYWRLKKLGKSCH